MKERVNENSQYEILNEIEDIQERLSKLVYSWPEFQQAEKLINKNNPGGSIEASFVRNDRSFMFLSHTNMRNKSFTWDRLALLVTSKDFSAYIELQDYIDDERSIELMVTNEDNSADLSLKEKFFLKRDDLNQIRSTRAKSILYSKSLLTRLATL